MLFRKKYRLNKEEKIEITLMTLIFFSTSIFAIVIILAGGIVNMKVLLSNNGKMPVLSTLEISTNRHFSFQNFSEVEYPYFSDIIKIKNIPFLPECAFIIFSIGDLIIFSGIFITIFLIGEYSIKKHKFNRRMKKKYGKKKV